MLEVGPNSRLLLPCVFLFGVSGARSAAPNPDSIPSIAPSAATAGALVPPTLDGNLSDMEALASLIQMGGQTASAVNQLDNISNGLIVGLDGFTDEPLSDNATPQVFFMHSSINVGNMIVVYVPDTDGVVEPPSNDDSWLAVGVNIANGDGDITDDFVKLMTPPDLPLNRMVVFDADGNGDPCVLGTGAGSRWAPSQPVFGFAEATEQITLSFSLCAESVNEFGSPDFEIVYRQVGVGATQLVLSNLSMGLVSVFPPAGSTCASITARGLDGNTSFPNGRGNDDVEFLINKVDSQVLALFPGDDYLSQTRLRLSRLGVKLTSAASADYSEDDTLFALSSYDILEGGVRCGDGVVDAGEDCEPPGVGACGACCTIVTCVPPSYITDFTPAVGWTVGDIGDAATSGIWANGLPAGTAAQPGEDHGETDSACFVTGIGIFGGAIGDADVDGGKTTLISPTLSLSDGGVIGYWRWYSNSAGGNPNTETFRVDVSNNGGGAWTNVETVGPSGAGTSGGWIRHEFNVGDFVTPTSQIRVRFVAEDQVANGGAIVEAAIDDFDVVPNDCNHNCVRDATDIAGPTSDDCNANGIPDECDVIDCLGNPACGDCNFNQVPDGCDIASCIVSPSCMDVGGAGGMPDGVPDGCAPFVDLCGANQLWSCPQNWNLPTMDPFPDNSGAASYDVTLGAGELSVLDVSVELDSLRLLTGATLKVTQTGAIGNLTIATVAGVVNQGTIDVAASRTINVSGDVVIADNGVYQADPIAPPGSVSAALTCAGLLIRAPVVGGDPAQCAADFSQSMSFVIGGSLVLDGTNGAPCTQDGGATWPKVKVRGQAFGSIAQDLTLLGQVEVSINSPDAVMIGGDFNNASVSSADCFDCEQGALNMNGAAAQAFEVAGEDVGATASGFAHPSGHTNFSVGMLEISGGAGQTVTFRNHVANLVGAEACSEALYVHELILRSGAAIELKDVRMYHQALTRESNTTIITTGCGELVRLCSSNADCAGDPPDNSCNRASCVGGRCMYSCVSYGNANGDAMQLVNLDDLLYVLAGFSFGFGTSPNADIAPCGGNGMINLDDILASLAAFSGADACGCLPGGIPPLCGSPQP